MVIGTKLEFLHNPGLENHKSLRIWRYLGQLLGRISQICTRKKWTGTDAAGQAGDFGKKDIKALTLNQQISSGPRPASHPAKPEQLAVSTQGPYTILLTLVPVGASWMKPRALELQSCVPRGVMLCYLLAKDWLQEARDSGMTRRTFPKLLTGAAGSHHGQHGVTTCNRTRAGGLWHALSLRVMRHKRRCCQQQFQKDSAGDCQWNWRPWFKAADPRWELEDLLAQKFWLSSPSVQGIKMLVTEQ